LTTLLGAIIIFLRSIYGASSIAFAPSSNYINSDVFFLIRGTYCY